MRARMVRLSIAAWLLCSGLPAAAQVASGEITGAVRDQAGAAVPGASVEVTALATNLTQTAICAADGVYAVPGLAPGDYRVDVRMTGFRPVRRETVRIATGQTIRLDFDLTIGG